MTDTFGKILRKFRMQSDIGLRELARLIDKSPGYLSDVEQDNVPPPSEAVIVNMANALNVDKDQLLLAAHKMDPELSSYIAEEPQAADFLRMAKEKKFKGSDWEKLSKIAKLIDLGKTKKDTK
ncbi:MAG: helix-turn-helix domain-containing protein [Desulfobacterales bacterium]|jgi:transcriptional regulator with XRE-family HTH domain